MGNKQKISGALLCMILGVGTTAAIAQEGHDHEPAGRGEQGPGHGAPPGAMQREAHGAPQGEAHRPGPVAGDRRLPPAVPRAPGRAAPAAQRPPYHLQRARQPDSRGCPLSAGGPCARARCATRG